jgi:two-component system response regulator DesR
MSTMLEARSILRIRILIADDSEAVKDGLTALLESYSEFEIAGYASNGTEAIERTEELRPDIVIMDAQMPNLDGIEATRRIKQSMPYISVLVFSIFQHHLEASFVADADSFLLKDCEPEDLISRLREIAQRFKTC